MLDNNVMNAACDNGKSRSIIDQELSLNKEEERKWWQSQSWYHPNITREDAEKRIYDFASKVIAEGRDAAGLFLVRDSNQYPGYFALAVYLSDGSIGNYHIKLTSGSFFHINKEVQVYGLDHIIKEYQKKNKHLPEKLGEFVAGQPPPRKCYRYGFTNLLHDAVRNGDADRVIDILRSPHCPDVDAKNQKGTTAIIDACANGNAVIVKALLQDNRKADVNLTDSNCRTALHYACDNQHTEILEILLKTGGADPMQAQLPRNNTVLHDAATFGHYNCIKTLLSYQVPAWPQNEDHDTPYSLAQRLGHKKCAELIKNYKAQKPGTNRSEWYHGSIKTEEAMKLFDKQNKQDRLFLVRDSTTSTTAYVLMVAYQDNVSQYLIEKHRELQMYHIQNDPMFNTLAEVVWFYHRWKCGLKCHLMFPIYPTAQRTAINTAPAPLDSPIIRRAPPVPFKPKQTAAISAASVKKVEEPKTQPETTGQPASEIRERDIVIGKELGEGEFGTVYSGVWSHNGNKIDVAVKTLISENYAVNEQQFKEEAQLMSHLQHPHIVRLYGVCSAAKGLLMVQELAPMGSLLDYLVFESKNIVHKDLIVWGCQVADGMRYLEEMKYIHRDLATRNILLVTKEQVKISDFGLSRAVSSESDYYVTKKGGKWPVKWYAPECIMFGKFSHLSDVWSYGITLWEMFSYGRHPYGDMPGNEVLSMLKKGERLKRPKKCPQSVYEIMKKCWNFNSSERPDFKDLRVQMSKLL